MNENEVVGVIFAVIFLGASLLFAWWLEKEVPRLHELRELIDRQQRARMWDTSPESLNEWC